MIAFDLFGLDVYAYGLCAAIAALVCFGLTAWLCRVRKLPMGTASLFGLLGVVLGVVCSRAVFCLFQVSTFTQTFENPWLMFCFFDGGFSMTGLIGGVFLAAALTAKVQHIRAAELCDAMCAPLAFAIAILRYGEQFTDLGVGKIVEPNGLEWLLLQYRMGVSVEYRLAVFLYEAAAALLLGGVLLAVYLRSGKRGHVSLLFLALYGASQVLLESMRDDGHLLLTFLRVAQVAAALLPVFVSIALGRRCAKKKDKPARTLWGYWLVLALCVVLLVLLEFSLDGRLTWGTPSLGRDYGIMAAVCLVLGAIPCHLYRKAYARD